MDLTHLLEVYVYPATSAWASSGVRFFEEGVDVSGTGPCYGSLSLTEGMSEEVVKPGVLFGCQGVVMKSSWTWVTTSSDGGTGGEGRGGFQ